MDECKKAVKKITAIEELLGTINNELTRLYGLNRRLRIVKEKVSGENPEKEEVKDTEDPSTLLQKLSSVSIRLSKSNSTLNNLLDELESTI